MSKQDARILLVEDEPVVVDILQRLFKPEGYRIKVVDRGDVAVAELEHNQNFDLIITDLGVIACDKRAGGLSLVETAPGVTVEEIVAATGAPLDISSVAERAA